VENVLIDEILKLIRECKKEKSSLLYHPIYDNMYREQLRELTIVEENKN